MAKEFSFRNAISKYLNSIQNPAVKLKNLSNSIDYLYNSIINKQFYFSNINDEFKELLLNNNMITYNLFMKLTEKVIINGKSTKIGFNSLKVKSLYTDYDLTLLLESLDSLYIQIYETIYKINKLSNGDMNIFKSLNILINGVDNELYRNILRFTERNEYFPFIFRQERYENDRDDDIEHVSVFLMVYSYLLLFSLYRHTGHFYVNLLDNVIEDSTMPTIVDSFDNYLIDNKSRIANNISDFFVNNLLSMSGSISKNITNEVKTIIRDELLRLPVLLNTFGVNDFSIISNIVYDSTEQIYSHTSLKNTYGSFYEELNSIIDITKTYDEFVNEEINCKNETSKWFKSNINELQMLEYIAYQFSEDPKFFFNVYYLVHNKLSIDLIDKISNSFDLSSWMNNIKYIPEEHAVNFQNYIDNHQLQYDPDIIKLVSFVYLNQHINSFCESDIFGEWIVDIIKQLRTGMYSQYLYDFNDYEFIDNFRLIFKLIFTKDILDDILFSDLISKISSKFDNVNLVKCTSEDLSSMSKETFNSFIDSNILTKILDAFFKAAIVDTYLETGLNNFKDEDGVLETYSLQ